MHLLPGIAPSQQVGILPETELLVLASSVHNAISDPIQLGVNPSGHTTVPSTQLAPLELEDELLELEVELVDDVELVDEVDEPDDELLEELDDELLLDDAALQVTIVSQFDMLSQHSAVLPEQVRVSPL